MRRRFLGGEDSNLTIDLGSALAHAMLYSTGLPLAQKWGEFMQRTCLRHPEKEESVEPWEGIYNCSSQLFPALLFCPGFFTCPRHSPD